MAENELDLRAGDRVWGRLVFKSAGQIVLEHSLTEFDIETCPGLVLYDHKGKRVNADRAEDGLRLSRPDGTISHKLRLDRRNVVDVLDPKRQVRLELQNCGDEWIFNPRWSKS